MSELTTSPLDISELLTNETIIEAYLNEMLADGTPSEFMQALGYVAKARGITQIAKDTGKSRTSLYKSLKTDKISLDSLKAILDSLGLQIAVVAKTKASQLSFSPIKHPTNQILFNTYLTIAIIAPKRGFLASFYPFTNPINQKGRSNAIGGCFIAKIGF